MAKRKAQEPATPAAPTPTPSPFAGLVWHDARDMGLEGKGWSDTAACYDRFPARAEGKVRPPVWDLSRHSAGMALRFRTDARKIAARWTLRNANLAMSHMPSTGVSGLDLYARDESGAWRWVAVGLPEKGPTWEQVLVDGLAPGRREYLLYLPLYNGVTELAVGVPAAAKFAALGPRKAKPVVFYGTSIIQGGCASRPGMCYSAILGRWLDCPTINLGFSGNGQMEPEVADLLAELNPAAYVLDAGPNMSAALITERAESFVRKLRSAHPRTPIVLVEDRTYGQAWIIPGHREQNNTSRKAMRAVYRRLMKAGFTRLAYVKGEHLLGNDDEAAVDGSHPTDLGFMRMAREIAPVLHRVLRS